MKSFLRNKFNLDLSEWILLALSWLIYIGGLIFFADADNSWVMLVLGSSRFADVES